METPHERRLRIRDEIFAGSKIDLSSVKIMPRRSLIDLHALSKKQQASEKEEILEKEEVSKETPSEKKE